MKTLLTTLLLLSATVLFGQASINWIQNTSGVSLALDNSNNVFTIRSEGGAGEDIILTKRNSNGVLIWENKYDQTDPMKTELAVWVETDLSGNAIVCGNLSGTNITTINPTATLTKFDDNGNVVWRIVFDNSGDAFRAVKCIVDAEGNSYILGSIIGNVAGFTIVKKISPDGTILWSYGNNSGIGSPVTFKFSADNNIVIASKQPILGTIGFARIDLNGNEIWSISEINSTSTCDIAGDANGNTYLTYRQNISVTPGSQVRKVDASGNQIWLRSVNLLSQFIETGTDGAPTVCGQPFTNSGEGTAFAKFSAEGSLLWINSNADGQYNFVQHAQLKLDEQNNGYLAASTGTQMGVCKVNSNGNSGWVFAIDGSGAKSLDLGSDKGVYVAGGVTAKIRQFNTSCPAPQNNTVSDITATSVRFSWNAVAGAIGYEILYRNMISPSVVRLWERIVVTGNATTYMLNGLKCNTNYQWRMRTICDTLSPVALTGYTAVQTFRTADCPNIMNESEAGHLFEVQEGDQTLSTIPGEFYLGTNYPNPFNPTTVIEFGIAEDAHVTLRIYNSLGQTVAELVNEYKAKGTYSVVWNGVGMSGSILSGGVYFYKLTAGSYSNVKKMLLSK